MGQIKFIVSLVLIGLFSIAMLSFAINFGIDNKSTVNVANDSGYSTLNNQLKTEVSTFYTDSNTSATALYQTTVGETEVSEGGTAFKVGPTTALLITKLAITSSYTKIFGSDSGFGIFFTALISVLGFISIMYIYKAWFGRNPD